MDGNREAVKEALYKRATGYEYDEKEVVIDKSGNMPELIKLKKKHMPPDLNAIKTVLEMMTYGTW